MVIQNSLLIREFKKKLLRFQPNAKEGPKKYPVYLKLP